VTAHLVTAGLVLPAADGEPVADGAVLVREGVIEAVGPVAAVERHAAGAVRWDYPDGTLLPGLIDAHVHLVFDASEDPVSSLRSAPDGALLLQMAGRARRLLDGGVTTVRDLGDRDGLAMVLRDAVAAGDVPGPRILAAGAPLTITGGHCWFLGGEADGEDEMRRRTRRNLRQGADLVKIMVTGGTLTPGGPARFRSQFSDREIAVAVAEARRFGRKVAAHVHGTAGIAAAVHAGVDTLEHCTFFPPGGLAADALAAPGARAEREELIARIASTGTFVCPTLSAGIGEYLDAIGPSLVEHVLELVGEMHDRGVRLIAGTDAGMRGSRFGELAAALDWYAKAGMSPAAVLSAATASAADALGLGDRTGRLAPGLAADLLVVHGDPRADLGSLRHPLLVLAAGRPHRPETVGTR
jgi:imidazolonepropionase-like amidohydrolase